MPSMPAPVSALGYESTPGGAAGRDSAEAKSVVAAAAVVSVFGLLLWGGVLWMFLRPSEFSGRLILQPWPSVEFGVFALRAALHVAILAGALAAMASETVARRVLLPAALGLVAVGLYHFAQYNVFPTKLLPQRQGADQVAWLVMDGMVLVGTYGVYGLMALVLARPPGRRVPTGAGRPAVMDLIVAGAAVDSVVRLADRGVMVWVALQPWRFKTVGSGAWTPHAVVMMAAAVLLHGAIIAGAAEFLRRRSSAGRRLLLVGAAGLMCVSAYSYVRASVMPPPGMPRYVGAERITHTVNGVGRVVTGEMIHALVVFAMVRRGGSAWGGAGEAW